MVHGAGVGGSPRPAGSRSIVAAIIEELVLVVPDPEVARPRFESGIGGRRFADGGCASLICRWAGVGVSVVEAVTLRAASARSRFLQAPGLQVESSEATGVCRILPSPHLGPGGLASQWSAEW